MAKKKVDEGFLNAMRFCIYPTDETDKTVLIPEDELEIGGEDLSVRYLISTYGFNIQSVIPGSIQKNEHFEPAVREKIDIIQNGLMFKKLDNGYVYEIIEVDTEDGFITIQDTQTKKEKCYQKKDLLAILKSGKYSIQKSK